MAFGGIATFFSDHQTFFLGLLNIFLGRPNIFRWLLMSSELCRSIHCSMTFVARPFFGQTSSIFTNPVKQHFATAFDGFLARLFFISEYYNSTKESCLKRKQRVCTCTIIRGSKKSNIGNRGDELRGAQVIRSYSMLQLLSHPHPLPGLLLAGLHPPCSSVLLFLHSRQCLAPNTSASLRCLL